MSNKIYMYVAVSIKENVIIFLTNEKTLTFIYLFGINKIKYNKHNKLLEAIWTLHDLN